MAAERTLAKLLAAFLEARRVRGYSLQGESRAERILEAFLADLESQGIADARAVSEADIVAFVRHVQTRTNRFGREASPDQLARVLGAVRAFFAFLEKRGLVLASPARGLRLPRTSRLPRTVLSQAEARRLMAAPHPATRTGTRDRALLEVFYGTGIRLSECLRLDLLDLDLLAGSLLVRNGKGRKDRVVPIAGRAALALALYSRYARPQLARQAHEPALFLSKDGRRLSATRTNRIVAHYAHAARIKKRVHPHVLRHTCATHLLKGGADVRHVQQLLGHARLETTALYTRVDVADLREVLLRSHPRERGK